jgi:hypothetical protein
MYTRVKKITGVINKLHKIAKNTLHICLMRVLLKRSRSGGFCLCINFENFCIGFTKFFSFAGSPDKTGEPL